MNYQKETETKDIAISRIKRTNVEVVTIPAEELAILVPGRKTDAEQVYVHIETAQNKLIQHLTLAAIRHVVA